MAASSETGTACDDDDASFWAIFSKSGLRENRAWIPILEFSKIMELKMPEKSTPPEAIWSERDDHLVAVWSREESEPIWEKKEKKDKNRRIILRPPCSSTLAVIFEASEPWPIQSEFRTKILPASL